MALLRVLVDELAPRSEVMVASEEVEVPLPGVDVIWRLEVLVRRQEQADEMRLGS